jgi:hypothetical protein
LWRTAHWEGKGNQSTASLPSLTPPGTCRKPPPPRRPADQVAGPSANPSVRQSDLVPAADACLRFGSVLLVCSCASKGRRPDLRWVLECGVSPPRDIVAKKRSRSGGDWEPLPQGGGLRGPRPPG